MDSSTHADLTGSAFIVTGASSGIGRATVAQLTARGAEVAAVARRQAELDTTVAAAGPNATAIIADVTDEAAVQAAVATTLERFGRLDGIVSTAGALGELGPVTELSRSGWDETLASNLTSAWLCAKAAIPAMLATGGGSIVNVSSFVGPNAAFPGTAAYGAAKAGLIGLTKTLAVEWSASGVRANALIVGGVDTPMFRGSFGATDEGAAGVASLHALGRVGTPDEIAAVAVFLLSPASSFMTGAAVPVEGGLTAGR
jgi:NAD(P)-dependent dehydrogenase (short-subunit alcohol dehydrogenase family)